MTGIWMENVGGWSLQSPQAFENERALHDMVLGIPELLPLTGSCAVLDLLDNSASAHRKGQSALAEALDVERPIHVQDLGKSVAVAFDLHSLVGAPE